VGVQPARGGAPAIVALPPTIDIFNAGQVHDRMCAAVDSGAPVVIADLSATVFCDIAGADRLSLIASQAAARGSQVRLVIPQGSPLRQVLVLLGVDHLLPVYSSIREACQPATGPRHPLFS
jgi:anti-anti-sigma regulatory factor